MRFRVSIVYMSSIQRSGISAQPKDNRRDRRKMKALVDESYKTV